MIGKWTWLFETLQSERVSRTLFHGKGLVMVFIL